LARFQLGETGEGRIARDIYRFHMAGIDDDYRQALGLFIAEEGRHARILGGLVRALGGRLLARTWTARLFSVVRGLMGIRFKLLVLLAAEVVATGFYGMLARALPASPLRSALEEIAGDEAAHLAFHQAFVRTAAPGGWRRALFRVVWTPLAWAAVLAVLWDHRRTLSCFGLQTRAVVPALGRLIGRTATLKGVSPRGGRPFALAAGVAQ